MSEAKQARRFFVSGAVQAVGFRYFAQLMAERLQITGYVRNLRDGRVEAYAIGTGEQLAAFRSALEEGPRGATVTRLDEEPAALESQFANEFVITYTA